ncbi:hypothetical protein, partial [Xanthomonas euvesicatoria]|uniref:hypothetical protein n=1 Tax=Xanthomonas euvesicatoria TaxID=456327 RepID=UPI000A9FEA87
LHSSFRFHENAGIAVVAVCDLHYHFTLSLLARHSTPRLLGFLLRLNTLQALLLDALLMLLDGQADFCPNLAIYGFAAEAAFG